MSPFHCGEASFGLSRRMIGVGLAKSATRVRVRHPICLQLTHDGFLLQQALNLHNRGTCYALLSLVFKQGTFLPPSVMGNPLESRRPTSPTSTGIDLRSNRSTTQVVQHQSRTSGLQFSRMIPRGTTLFWKQRIDSMHESSKPLSFRCQRYSGLVPRRTHAPASNRTSLCDYTLPEVPSIPMSRILECSCMGVSSILYLVPTVKCLVDWQSSHLGISWLRHLIPLKPLRFPRGAFRLNPVRRSYHRLEAIDLP
jgi:hypothetical protein